ncbi:Hypothetical predicted protein [Mytilus galloprovincialis]|uniref:Ig-like domain-containing protein n=1 Tax=Mytilus galloprovincialis TaxID=29158 RepID=A0A8B6BY02_MYTGA|nr:Hypothetical predicted protein [Mytilus galloprovincialis]
MFLLNRGHSCFFGKILLILMQIGGVINETDVIEYVKENSTTVLECSFKSISGSVAWIRFPMSSKNEGHEVIAKNRNVNPDMEHIKVVGNHTIGEYNLLLQQITKADEKIYKCVSTINKKPLETEVSVRLSTSNDEIQILNVNESNTVVGFIGISLILKCISEHQHPSSISWSTNGNLLCESQGNVSAYELIPKEEQQNAIYACTASYIGKKIRKSVRLNILITISKDSYERQQPAAIAVHNQRSSSRASHLTALVQQYITRLKTYLPTSQPAAVAHAGKHLNISRRPRVKLTEM